MQARPNENPPSNFNPNNTWASTIYKFGRPAYYLYKNFNPSALAMHVAMPVAEQLAKFTNTPSIVNYTETGVNALGLYLNPVGFLANQVVSNYVNPQLDETMSSLWDTLTPEQRESTFYRELFGLANIAKYELGAQITQRSTNIANKILVASETQVTPSVTQSPDSDNSGKIELLYKQGYKLYKHTPGTGNNFGGHMNPSQAMEWLSQPGNEIEAKNTLSHQKTWFGSSPKISSGQVTPQSQKMSLPPLPPLVFPEPKRPLVDDDTTSSNNNNAQIMQSSGSYVETQPAHNTIAGNNANKLENIKWPREHNILSDDDEEEELKNKSFKDRYNFFPDFEPKKKEPPSNEELQKQMKELDEIFSLLQNPELSHDFESEESQESELDDYSILEINRGDGTVEAKLLEDNSPSSTTESEKKEVEPDEKSKNSPNDTLSIFEVIPDNFLPYPKLEDEPQSNQELLDQEWQKILEARKRLLLKIDPEFHDFESEEEIESSLPEESQESELDDYSILEINRGDGTIEAKLIGNNSLSTTEPEKKGLEPDEKSKNELHKLCQEFLIWKKVSIGDNKFKNKHQLPIQLKK